MSEGRADTPMSGLQLAMPRKGTAITDVRNPQARARVHVVDHVHRGSIRRPGITLAVDTASRNACDIQITMDRSGLTTMGIPLIEAVAAKDAPLAPLADVMGHPIVSRRDMERAAATFDGPGRTATLRGEIAGVTDDEGLLSAVEPASVNDPFRRPPAYPMSW